ncbi:MAG: hypothetical protein ABTQ26_08955 [Azonexus sp.]
MDQKTADILSELIQSQVNLLRAVHICGSLSSDDLLKEGVRLHVEESTRHLEEAARVLANG